MTPSTDDPEFVSVTIDIPRRHALAIRGTTGTENVESALDLISSTSRAVFKAVKDLPPKAFNVQPPPAPDTVKLEDTYDMPKVPFSIDDDREFAIGVTWVDNLSWYPSSHTPLPCRIPSSWYRRQFEIVATLSTTIQGLAERTAKAMECTLDAQDLISNGMFLWGKRRCSGLRPLPADTMIGTLGMDPTKKPFLDMIVIYDQATRIRLQKERNDGTEFEAARHQSRETPSKDQHTSNVSREPSPSMLRVLVSEPDTGVPIPSVPIPSVTADPESEYAIDVEVLVQRAEPGSALSLCRSSTTISLKQRFNVRRSTTIHSFAQLTADRLGCPLANQLLHFRGKVLWSGSPWYQRPPAGMTLGSLGVIGSERLVEMAVNGGTCSKTG
ncbi:uncharacterized protein RCC_03940 [Ramularia collo-cygni]|uniref:Ubiquitin-like domain-containing protein n=1 Tax=Ramularia collo-cygni TaxID=112498 RepID=A0A2D3UY36_9PEZI|nr:uncharacterized protein RCC_03940 [Ramularia collo-cygni]CZT18100.1 uncharacterized protein RCC_03940 [Ramularia collo-cygni]